MDYPKNAQQRFTMKRLINPLLGLTLIATVLLVQNCSSTSNNPPRTQTESTPESVDELLSAANQRSGNEAAEFLLIAIDELLESAQIERTEQILARIENPLSLNQELRLHYAIAQAELALLQEAPATAIDVLTGPLAADIASQPQSLRYRYYLGLANSYRAIDEFQEAILALLEIDAISADLRTQELHDEIWLSISQLSGEQLSEFARAADSYELRGWIELSRIARQQQFNIKSQIDSITQWRRIWSSHTASALLPSALSDLEQIWEARPMRLALLLPLQTAAGIAIQEGFLSAYYQALEVSRDVPQIAVFDTSNTKSITAIYNDAVASGADLIIGPLDKVLVNQLQEMSLLPVPTLALNYADRPDAGPANLFQFGLAPEDEMAQAAKLAWNAGYRNAAIVTPQTDDYLRLRSIFSEIWQSQGGAVVSEASFSGDSDYSDLIKHLMAIDASEARADRLLGILPRNNIEFIPRRRGDIDFIYLIANPRQGRQIKPTLAFYFAEDVPVIALSAIYDGQQNQSANRDLDGIVFTDAPWLLNADDPLKVIITANLRQAQGPSQRLRAMGVDSFRLYPLLQQLESGQLTNVGGTTGALTMTANRRIRRELAIATFIDGLATLSITAGENSD